MKSCPRCSTPVGDDGVCAACLLPSLAGGEDRPKAERIFQAALALGEAERVAFIENAANGDGAALEEAMLLLEGYAEAGGDAAEGTLGGAARSQWATVRKEEPGTVIDHFRLVRVIGEGGMGSVWEAEQSVPFKRRVALKIIKLGMDTEEVVRRFERERRTLALMTHPHIAQVFEAGATPAGRPYFAMELVEGTAITTHCAREKLPVVQRLGLFLEVCAAVEHAHQKGIIHRDLKPSNILVAADGVKVIDFGVAKATQEGAGDGLVTRQQQVLGTPAYMSPEQADSNGADVDTRTDVYSLGAVLYELLSGELPFDPKRLASTHLQEVQRILREETPLRPSTRVEQLNRPNRSHSSDQTPPTRGEISGDLDWIVMKALSKERERRYASAAAFAADVRRFLNCEAVSAVPPTLAYRFGKFVRRNKAAVAAMAGIILALTAGLIVSLRQVQRTNEALAEAETARAGATNTLADMYTRSGITAGEGGNPTLAALWFANAAILGTQDPVREGSNRLRAEAWRAEASTAMHAFDTGASFIRCLAWNPALPVVMVNSPESDGSILIWDLQDETRWPHDRNIQYAAWSPSGKWLAAIRKTGELVVMEYPGGREAARFPGRPTPGQGGAADVPVAWSPDSPWIAAGDALWEWQTGETRPLPARGERFQFDREGRRLLVQMASSTGICETAAPGTFLHPPVDSLPDDRAAFAGNGEHYVVGSPDQTVRVHDCQSGALLQSFPRAPPSTTRPPRSPLLGVSPDGRFAIQQNQPLLDLQTGQRLDFPRHDDDWRGFAFSPDGTRLVSGGTDESLKLWSFPDGKFLGLVGNHSDDVSHAAFSVDGNFVVSAERGLIRVWDIRPAWSRRTIMMGDNSQARISRDGRLLTAAGFTQSAIALRSTRAFHLPSGEAAGPEITPGGRIMDAAWAPDASWLALAVSTWAGGATAEFPASDDRGSVQFWNPMTGERLSEPVLLPSEPRGLALDPSGEWLGATCSRDGLEVNIATRQIRPLFHQPPAPHPGDYLSNGSCAYSADGRIFAAWGAGEFVHLWDRAAGRDFMPPFLQGCKVFDLAMHGDTAALAIRGKAMRIEFRHLRTGERPVPDIPYANWPLCTQFSEDGALLLSGGRGNSAQIWDWRSGSLACPVMAHDDAIMAAIFLPGTPWLITGGNDRKIRFWDRRTGTMIRPPLQCHGYVLGLQLTPDARTLVATGHFGGRIELFDLRELLPATDLPPKRMKLRAEIDACAEVHPGGGLAPLTQQAWLGKWRTLRATQH